MSERYQALSEKEKQALRLIGQGHDAKSSARQLGLSVHTVNERLRTARRKLAVSSSREAARTLAAAERDPDFLVHKQMGEAGPAPAVPDDRARKDRRGWIVLSLIIGGFVMVAVVAIIALASLSPVAPPLGTAAQTTPAAEAVSVAAIDPEVEQAARRWLVLVDAGRWRESWNATGQAFRKLVTHQQWASISAGVRPPLGAVVSRRPASQEKVPAPPHGYQIIKFRTTFANKPDALETVSLEREGGVWKVVGYWIA